MSGHSKWAKIKRGKAITDAKRGALFSKLSKEIMVAVKLGGPDPDSNFRLRFAIDKAKINQFPQSNIERAIQKASGKDSENEQIEEIIYEGYGPDGVAILILCTTDNKTRTVQDVRSYFTKYGGNLAQSGAVLWMFNKCGEIKLKKSYFKNQDECYEIAIEAGAEDIDFSDEDYVILITKFEDLEKVQKNIIQKKIRPEESEIIYKPKETVPVNDPETGKKIIKLLDVIEEHDDVQNTFSNFELLCNLQET